MVYCTRAYGVKNSGRQIKNSPISTESQFAKFNAHQIFPLYGKHSNKSNIHKDSHAYTYVYTNNWYSPWQLRVHFSICCTR